MKNIDKELYSSLEGIRGPFSKEMVCTLAYEEGNDFVNALFRVFNTKLDELVEKGHFNQLNSIFEYMDIVIANAPQLNRKTIERKMQKLSEKMDQILVEQKEKLVDTTIAYKELGLLKEELSKLQVKVTTKECKQMDFIEYLIHETKNIGYLEKTFEKMPSIINVQDKDENSLLTRVVETYIEKLEEPKENREDLLYYNNVISLIMSQESLNLKPKEYHKILNTLNNYSDQTMKRKNRDSFSKEKCAYADTVKSIIKEDESKNFDIENLGAKYQIPISFNERLIEELGLYQTNVSVKAYPDRVIASDYIMTIDNAGTAQLDDGISCKKMRNGNYLLGVHSASVLGYLPYESPLVEEAINRGFSIYIPKRYATKEEKSHRFIPIFPSSFTTQQASLIKGEKRLARSYYFEIDQEGEVINQKFLKTIVTNKRKTTYDQINTVIKKQTKQGNIEKTRQVFVPLTEEESLQETIRCLTEVTSSLTKKYMPSELYLKIQEENPDYAELKMGNTTSEKLVYQCLRFTGHKVAEYFAEQGYPCLYRVHEMDSVVDQKLEETIQNLTTTYGGQKFEKLYHLLSGIYPKSRYDIAGGHQGLGLDHYCHCTSELRKAPAIIVEHALEVCYDKNPTDKEVARLEAEIKKQAIKINQKTAPIEWFKQDYERCVQKVKR